MNHKGRSLRPAAAFLGAIAVLLLLAGCSKSGESSGLSLATVVPSESTGSANTSPVASTEPAPSPTPDLQGFAFPIKGGCLPTSNNLMPNAVRAYRKGIHEGVDLYGVDNCTPITVGTPALAAKAGRVIRADVDYVNLTPGKLQAILADPTTPESFDAFRGRQVWIDHGGGVVTRYCHLNGIAEGLKVGDQVGQGQVVGYVGETGTPESVTNPGHEYHLHFEIRVGDSYLGAGLPADEVRALYLKAFAR